MKKNLSRIIWTGAVALSLTATLAVGSVITSKKADPQTPQTQQVRQADADTDSMNQIQAQEVTVTYTYYYREYNGWLQRRLWNRTYGKWAWSSWRNYKKLK